MSGLSNIFVKDPAEGASQAPSASPCLSCSGKPLQEDPLSGLPAFGYPEKLASLREESPDCPVDGYILFGSHTDALALFDAAKSQGHSVRISPTPRAARATCGIALLVDCDEVMAVYEIACEKGIAIENMVALPRQIKAKRDRFC